MAEATIEKRPTNHRGPERVRPGRTYIPTVDIIEKPEEFLLLADMPGVRSQDVDVRYEKGLLTIQAHVEPRRDDESTRYLFREYGIGDFHRSFELGDGIDASRIEAEMRRGVLHLHLPKAESVKPRKITVRSS